MSDPLFKALHIAVHTFLNNRKHTTNSTIKNTNTEAIRILDPETNEPTKCICINCENKNAGLFYKNGAYHTACINCDKVLSYSSFDDYLLDLEKLIEMYKNLT